MKVVAGAVTDIGKVREGNEDAYLADEPLFAVADGMGGHRGGEVASKLALDTLEHSYRRRGGGLAEQVQEANRAVFERSQLDRRVAGMGTTLTAASVEGDRIRLAHVGDSRAYLLREGELRMLTKDHTVVRQMIERGEITEREAADHPYRSVLTRALGVDVAVRVDEALLEVREGDRIILCTDGLTGMVTEEQIRAILETVPDPNEAAARLVKAANRAGGIDNITVVLLDVLADDAQGEPVEEDAGDAAAAAPPKRRRRITAGRLAVLVGVPVAVAVVGIVGLRLYLDSQWYVGVQNSRVAVFRGIPAEVAGFKLHRAVVVTTIRAADAETLAVYQDLSDGITAADREEADAIVEQIRADVAASEAAGSP